MTGVVVYRCPDGVHISRYSDLRDCPLAGISVDLSASGTRTRFLGSRGHMLTPSEEAADFRETPEPTPLDRKKLVMLGSAAFALVLLIYFLKRRRRKR